MAKSLFQACYPILILGWALVQGLVMRSSTFPSGPVFWDSVLASQADPYLIFYAVLPVWLVAVGYALPNSGSEIWLLREGSWSRHLRSWTSRIACQASVVALMPTLAALATSFGLGLSSTWNPNSAESSLELANAGIPPWFAVLGQLLLLTASLVLVAVIAFILRLRWPTPAGTVTSLMAMFTVLIIGGMGASPVPLSLGFVIFTHGSAASAVATLGALLVTGLALWAAVRLHERRQRSMPTALRRLLLVWAGLAVLFFTHALPLRAAPFSLADLLYRAFTAGDAERVNPLGFTTYSLVFGAGALLIGSAAAQRDQGILPVLAVRYGRISRWGGMVLWRIFLLVLAYVASVLGVAGLVTVSLGGTLMSPDLMPALTTVGFVGVLQICFLATISAAAVTVGLGTRGTLALFAVTLFLAMPPINHSRVLPFGLSITRDPVDDGIARDLAVMSISTLLGAVAGLVLPRFAAIQRLILGRTN